MTLGVDISHLSADARSAASRGLSIVVPLYNEGAGLAQLHERIAALAKTLRQSYGLACEVVYVDDGSRDDTLAVARSLTATTLDVNVISLSRNFGKEAALMAGLDHARSGGAVLFMDGDGQHPPALVETLVRHWIEGGFDVVYTAKAHRRNESVVLRMAVRSFYSLMNFRARHKIPPDAGDFRLLSPRAAAALRQLPERNRFFKGLSSWIGFRQLRVDYHPEPRAHGRTSFSPGRLIGLSIDGLTSFSVAPLRFASMAGALIAVASFVVGLLILWETFINGKSVPGYASVIVGVMVLGGMQLVMIGVVGEYIGKIIYELKARPVYFVAEKTTRLAGSDMQIDHPLAELFTHGRRMSQAPATQRRISLCADDYGLSTGVNRAIRDLIGLRRLSATSVMVVAPAFTRDEIDALKAVAKDARGFSIGLHVTLTAPFHPLTIHFRPQKDGEFLKLGKLLQASVLRRLDLDMLRAEIGAQIAAFKDMTGQSPDHVDGHQHVQLFPQVREAFVSAVKQHAPNAWVRQSGRGGMRPGRFRDAKALMLDVLSKGFRDSASRAGLRFNPAFAGAYNFSKKPDFAKLFERFLLRLPDGGLIMCHPGFVDSTLIALDPLTHQRRTEYDWLISDDFPKLLTAQNVTLA